MKKILGVLCLLFCATLFLNAQDTVTEPETNTSFAATFGDSPSLNLMGVAPRTKWMFKVYGVGLYADPTAVNAVLGNREATDVLLGAAIRAMSGDRALVLKFVRDIGKDQMAGAFTEAIELTMPVDDERIAVDAKQLLDAFVDIKNGDEAVMYFSGDTITLSGNGKELVSLKNRLLGRALLSAYVGSSPIDENIKKKLLAKRP